MNLLVHCTGSDNVYISLSRRYNMAEITQDQLTSQHLASWQTIGAVDDSGQCRLVWDSRRLAPMMSSCTTAKATQSGVIRVASLEHDLDAVYAKLTSVAPHEGKRLVH